MQADRNQPFLTHVNSCKRLETSDLHDNMGQNFRLFHGSNLSVLNFRFFLFMYPVSTSPCDGAAVRSVRHSLPVQVGARPARLPGPALFTSTGTGPRRGAFWVQSATRSRQPAVRRQDSDDTAGM